MSILRKFSPKMSRKSKGHQQLSCDEADEKDRIVAGINFDVKYVGSTEVPGHRGTGKETTDPAVEKVYNDFKRKDGDIRSLKKRLMVVSAKSIVISEPCGDSVANFPIAKVTFCNVNARVEKTFVFVAKNRAEDPFKAFVFQCESQEKTKELFKAVSDAFNVHFETIQASKVRNPWSTQYGCKNIGGQNNEGNQLEGGQGLKMSMENKQQETEGNKENFVEQKAALISLNSPITVPSTGAATETPYDLNGNSYPDAMIPQLTQPPKHPSLLRVQGECFTRQRSKTDPSNYQVSLPSNQQFQNNNVESNLKTSSTPTLETRDDEFEAEFTRLAETRSSSFSGSSLHDDWTQWTGFQ